MFKRSIAKILFTLPIIIPFTQAEAAQNWETLYDTAVNYIFLDQFAKAEGLSNEALLLAEQQSVTSSEKLTKSLMLLAQVLQKENKLADAERISKRALELRQKATPRDEFGISESLARLTEIYQLGQQYVKAESSALQVVKIDEGKYGPNSIYMLPSLGALGSVYLAEKKIDEATPLFLRLLSIGKTSKGIPGRYVPDQLKSAAIIYRSIGRDELARELEVLASNQTLRFIGVTTVIPQPDEPAFSVLTQLRNPANQIAPISVTVPPEGTIRIGHAAPITGPLSNFGRDSERGAQLAIEELNTSNVVIGGKPIKFELISKDDGQIPETAVDTARELVATGISGVIGNLTSSATLNTARIFNSKNVIQITPSATNPVLGRSGFTTGFRMVANNISMATLLGNYVITTIKPTRIILIDEGRGYSLSVADAFTKSMLLKNVKIIDRISLLPIQKYNFSSEVTRIKDLNPDLIFFSGMDSTAGPLLTQLHQKNVNPIFVGMNGVCTERLSALTDDVEKVICAEANGITPDSSKSAKDFTAKFQQRFSEPAGSLAPYSYDAVKLLVAAMSEADSSEPQTISKIMHNFEYIGVAGKYQFDENGDLRNPIILVFGFRDGKKYLKIEYRQP